MTKICQRCGNEFTPRVYAGSIAKYCQVCRYQHEREMGKERIQRWQAAHPTNREWENARRRKRGKK
jgi:hypothetical protein